MAAPLLRDQPVVGQLLPHPLPVGVRQVDLVDGDDDRNFRLLGVVDGLDGLGHDAVVRGDHQDDDVGDLCAARPHGGECLVARRIEEGDLLFVHLDRVGADMLGDAAEFLAATLVFRMASRSFVLPWSTWPMTVTIGGRRSESSGLSSSLLDDGFIEEGNDIHLGAVFRGEDLGGFGVDHLVDGRHDAELHELGDDFVRLDIQLLGKLAHGYAFGYLISLGVRLLF